MRCGVICVKDRPFHGGPGSHKMPFPGGDELKTSATDEIAELLKQSKTIAVVGLSPSPLRPSHGVSAYMQAHGYRIIPVNPRVNVVLGEKSYSSIAEVPVKIDVVNIFRRSDAVPEIVDQAIQLKVPTIWMQETVVNDAAAQKARAAGIFVVM